MTQSPFHMGAFRCTPIIAGHFKLDGGAMLGIVPKALWTKAIPADENNRIDMVMRTLLIERDKRRVLIDCGIGDKISEKQKQIYAVSDDSKGMLLRNLKQHAGVTADQITDVILTHLHFDHAGGSTTLDKDGRPVPTFPNATYYIQKSHYDWVLKQHPRERASYWPENFEPLCETGQLKFLEGEQTIAFGELSVLVSNGHTIGQQLPKLSTPQETLVYCADLIPMHNHIPLIWHMAYDIQPLILLDEKEGFLNRAIQENWELLFEHDPRVIRCRVEKTAKGFVPKDIVKA